MSLEFLSTSEEGLISGALAYGISLGPRELQAFAVYYQELIRWGRRMNLTAFEEEKDVVIQGFLDSLALSLVYDFSSAPKLIDIGSGAGFPAIPLKICFPQFPCTLVDANHKKFSFLKHISRLLDLSQIEVLWTRSELLAEKQRFRGAFDVATARALGSLLEVGAQAYPFLRPRGLLLALRGGLEEIGTLPKGFALLKNVSYQLPGEDHGRRILVLEKAASSPN